MQIFVWIEKAPVFCGAFSISGLTRLSQVRGKTEDLAEAVVDLRRGQTAGFNEEIGQSRLPAGLCPAKKRQARKS